MNKYTLLLCGILFACNNPQKEITKDVSFKIKLSSLIEKGNAENISLEKWGNKIKFIPLETNDSILIKSINKIVQKNDKLLIVHTQRASIFDLKGKYLYDISRRGNGPEEYTSLKSLTVKNDTIFIKEGNNRIKLFNWQGGFIGQISTPELPILDLYPVPNMDVFLGHIPNRTGQNKNRLVIFRDTTILNLIPTSLTFERADKSLVITTPLEMRAFDGNVFAFKELFNDTIFQIKPDYSLYPYAIVDLGKNKADEGYRFTLTPNIVTQKKFDIFNGKIALTAIGEINDIIYMTPYNIMDKPYTFSFDKKSGKAYYQKITYPENHFELKEGSIFTPSFISTDSKYLIDFESTNNENNPIVVLVER